MTEGELKPVNCKDCGTKPQVFMSEDLFGNPKNWVTCSHLIDRHRGPVESTREQAIAAWNNRARKD